MTDVVAETSPVLAENTRLPRLRGLVMGGGATVALIAVVALVVPNVGTSASSAPARAPEFQLPELPAAAPRPDALELEALKAVKRTAVKHKAVTHEVAKDHAVPKSPSRATYAGAPAVYASEAPSTTNESHVVSNVQDVAPANANKNTQLKANRVAVTSADKHVNSNRSVNISNSSVQKVTSGSVKNSTHVSTSVKVSRSHTYSQSAP